MTTISMPMEETPAKPTGWVVRIGKSLAAWLQVINAVQPLGDSDWTVGYGRSDASIFVTKSEALHNAKIVRAFAARNGFSGNAWIVSVEHA